MRVHQQVAVTVAEVTEDILCGFRERRRSTSFEFPLKLRVYNVYMYSPLSQFGKFAYTYNYTHTHNRSYKQTCFDIHKQTYVNSVSRKLNAQSI